MQKTILERKGPPTFTCAVEMISKTECRVHHRLDATVDAILAGIFKVLFIYISKFPHYPMYQMLIVTILNPGKYPLFEVRRIEDEAKDHAGDTEANNSSKLTKVTEQNRLGYTIDKNSLKSTQQTGNDNVRDAEAYISLSSNRTEQNHFADFNMANVEIEENKIKGHKEVDDYHPKSKKIRSNITVSRKSPVYVYTYKVLVLPSSFGWIVSKSENSVI